MNNLEKQWPKLGSSYAMGSHHCIQKKGGFLNILFKIPIILCHWLSEIYWKKRRRWGSMHAVLSNSYLLYQVWLYHARLFHENNDKTRWQNDAQNATRMIFSYLYVVPVKIGSLQARRDRCCSLVKLLCTYFCYLNVRINS